MTEQWQATVTDVLWRPPEQIPSAAVDAGVSAARAAGRDALARLEQGIGVPIPTSPSGAQRIAREEAERILRAQLREMGVPPIALQIPTDSLTVDGIKALAYDTGKAYLETALRDYTGVPIRLPQRLTVAELERTVDAIIPDDAAEALELAIMVGTQYAASAITAALAGAAIGSTIPGLGTVVGVALALGVNALRESLREVPPHQQPCTSKVDMAMPPGVSPIQLVPWVAAQRGKVSRRLADERAVRMCGVGEIVTYNAYLNTLMRKLEPLARAATAVVGPYQIQTLLPYYEAAPMGVWRYDGRQVRWVQEDEWGAVTRTTALLRSRMAKLVNLAARARRVATLPAGEVASLRWDLVTELVAAGQQVVFTGSEESLRWYGELSGYLQQLQARESAIREAARTRFVRNSASNCRVEMRTQDGEQVAVEVCGPSADEMRAFCHGAWEQWQADNPQYADCIGPDDETAFQQPCQAWLRGDMTFEVGAGWWAQYVANVKRCGVRLPPGQQSALQRARAGVTDGMFRAMTLGQWLPALLVRR